MFKSYSLKNWWLSAPLGRKLGLYTAVVVLVMALSAVFNIRLMEYALGGFGDILQDNSRCYEVQTAFSAEMEAFAEYARVRNKKNRDEFRETSGYTRRCLSLLPSSCRVIGEERYARTWNLKNAYESYADARDALLNVDPDDSDFVPELYEIYSRQQYIQTYLDRLLQATMADGDRAYLENTGIYQRVPLLILAVSVLLGMAALGANRFVGRSWEIPIRKLVKSTRKIAVNDFDGEDIVVENRDEIGDLVQAFNKMKYATKAYINTMMTNYEMSERLHAEELERVQAEKRLEDTRMELLKSQINPHFLFNTLHTISCMAKLEEAETTDRMISSMSNLFRYNLKTTEQIVPLSQELHVMDDYIYIQKMRFGDRIRYRSEICVEADEWMIPAFTLQPLAENAIVHGLSKKEDGGSLVLCCRLRGEALEICLADTGLGMEGERLRELRSALKNSRTSKTGIGLGNIYQRIQALFPGGELRVMSRAGRGTVIRIRLPQKGETAHDRDIDCG